MAQLYAWQHGGRAGSLVLALLRPIHTGGGAWEQKLPRGKVHFLIFLINVNERSFFHASGYSAAFDGGVCEPEQPGASGELQEPPQKAASRPRVGLRPHVSGTREAGG